MIFYFLFMQEYAYTRFCTNLFFFINFNIFKQLVIIILIINQTKKFGLCFCGISLSTNSAVIGLTSLLCNKTVNGFISTIGKKMIVFLPLYLLNYITHFRGYHYSKAELPSFIHSVQSYILMVLPKLQIQVTQIII